MGIGLQVCACGELYVNYLSGESEWVDLGCDSLSVEVALTPFGLPVITVDAFTRVCDCTHGS